MKGFGPAFLDHALASIARQTYSDFEVVISDHSQDHGVSAIYQKWSSRLPIRYFPLADHCNGSENVNYTLSHATGRFIKILFLDDLFYPDDALGKYAQILSENPHRWMAAGCIHANRDLTQYSRPHHPRFHSKIVYGKNTLGVPSVIAFPNTDLRFDPRLIWLMDCEFYHRLFLTYGPPICIPDPLIVIRQWEGSMTNSDATTRIRNAEQALVESMYPKPVSGWKKWKTLFRKNAPAYPTK